MSSDLNPASSQYIPERDYAANDFKALGKPQGDLCGNCEAYYAMLYANRSIKSPFPPKCTKHVLTDLKSIKPTDFDAQEEYDEFLVQTDPVSWALRHFDWEARWYQEELLSCFNGNTEIYLANGTLKQIKDIEVGEFVLTYDEVGRRIFPKKVLRHLNNGIRDIYKIVLENGDELECTSDHKIYSWSKCGELNTFHNCPSYKSSYRSLDDGLTVGDRVFVLNKFNRFGDINDNDLAILLGYIGTDGTISSGRPSFTNTRKQYIDEFVECLKRKYPNDTYYVYHKDEHDYRGMHKKEFWTVGVNQGEFTKFLKEIDCTNKSNREFSILNYAFKFSEESLKLFINRCWSGDGCVYTNNSGITQLTLHSGNKEYLKKYRLLLRKFGIINSKVYKKSSSNAVTLFIQCVDDVLTFFKQIGQIYGKELKSQEAIEKSSKRIRRARRRFNKTSRQKIVSIEYIDKEEVYDIEVEDRHNFFANGAVVHNCSATKKVIRAGRRLGKTASLVIQCLHQIFTHSNFSILVIAPYQAQVDKIFDEFEKMLANSPELSSSIKRKSKSPNQRLELNNGSKILGFPSGAKSATGSEKIRGQDANCIPISTLVNVTEFSVKPLEFFRITDTVLGGDESKISVGNIEALISTGKKKILTLPTALTILRCTEDHPIFNGKDDIPAREAQEAIVSLAHNDLTFSKEAIIARLAGYNFGDGWLNEKQCGFAGQKEDLEQIITDLTLFGDIRHKITTSFKENEELGIRGTVSEFCSTTARDLLLGICPIGKKTTQPIRVPDSILNGKQYIKANFLSGLFSAEATGITYQANNKTVRTIDLSMHNHSEQNLMLWFDDIKNMLSSLNIRSNLIPIKKLSSDRFRGGIRICNEASNIDEFVKQINYCYNVKKRTQASQWKLYRHYLDIYFKDSWVLNRLIKSHEGTSSKISTKLKVPQSTIKYHRHLYHELYSANLKNPEELLEYYKYAPGYVKIPINLQGVRLMDEEDVYNLQSSAGHRFFANGIFTHNCIVLDEADYLADNDLEAILAILASYPSCQLWASSTPTGKHAKFFSWCIQKDLGFKEFHYIAHESPSWTEEAENLFRNTYDSISFEHEFLAEFGIQAQGVFRNDLIDKSIKSYDLPRPRSSPQSRIVMGVDWNGETNGVHIIVTEYWEGKYKVICKEIVKDGQFTQHTAIEKILELDEYYGCDFIYVDEGYGRVQVEMLHKLGITNPRSGLSHRVKPYAFNKQVEIRDPRTSMIIKKPAKPFLVNIAVLQLEQDRLILPQSEDTQILVKSKENETGNKSPGLVQQMRNFAIERVSVLGLPTYTQGDDHTLFAFLLSIVGFILEFSDLTKLHLSNAIYSVGLGDGGSLVVTDHPGAKMDKLKGPIVRQLDSGAPKGAFSSNMSSLFQSVKAKNALRKSMEAGNKETFSYHFKRSTFGRGSSLDKPHTRRENF